MFSSAIFRFLTAIVIMVVLPASVTAQEQKPEMLLYCGITMVQPMTEIARIFEGRENVRIVIAQGGSEDLYQSAKKSQTGDWYLPGEPSFRTEHFKEGLLGEYVTVGYNQMALMVKKGNPKRIQGDPRELLRNDVTAIIGNVSSGSIGKEAKTLLDGLGLYQKVIKVAGFLVPDSRSMVIALKKGEADVGLSWRATGYFATNREHVDVVDLDPGLAKPQALELSLFKITKHPDLARRFMELASGAEGQAIFRKHGFLDNKQTIQR